MCRGRILPPADTRRSDFECARPSDDPGNLKAKDFLALLASGGDHVDLFVLAGLSSAVVGRLGATLPLVALVSKSISVLSRQTFC